MRALNLLIKPASGLCNMACRYCFYRDEAINRDTYSFGMMSEETADLLTDRAFEYVGSGGSVTFAFQGGEPTLRGLDFYRRFACSAEEKAKAANITVAYAIQTNGLLIDAEFADFLAEKHFLTGLSLDGFERLHDDNRVLASDKKSYSAVMNAASLLKTAGAEFNILCVVTEAHTKAAASVYGFYKKNGFRYLQFIPKIPPIGQSGGVTAAGYGRFLKELFDVWYADFSKGDYISIRDFDNFGALIQGRIPELCSMRGKCGVCPVVEADGSVYPCDFYVLDGYRLGNLAENTLGELMTGEAALRFISDSEKPNPECAKCRWLFLCRTGCRRYKEPLEKSAGKNFFCKAYREFFPYVYPRLREIPRLIAEVYGDTRQNT